MAFCIRVKYLRRIAKRFEDLFDRLLELIEALIEAVHHRNPRPTFEGGEMTIDIAPFISVTLLGDNKMKFTLSNDTRDAKFSITPLTNAIDSEGEPVTVTEKLTSSDDSIVSITFDTPGDVHSGMLHFGKSGVCSVDYVATYKVGRNDQPLKQADATFVLTTGQIAPGTVQGGDFAVEGLTPDPEEPPV